MAQNMVTQVVSSLGIETVWHRKLVMNIYIYIYIYIADFLFVIFTTQMS